MLFPEKHKSRVNTYEVRGFPLLESRANSKF